MPRSSESDQAGSRGSARAAGVRELDTPLGPARLHLSRPAGSVLGVLALGHGAGGGVEAADLVAVAAAAGVAGWLAVRIEQPWRVAGKRVAPAPARLDQAWLPVIQVLLAELPRRSRLPLVLGGRSAGARVACRTAGQLGADGVCCLSFPLHPPGRPERSRADELAGAGVPVLVVQGRRDPFGGPDELAALELDGVQIVPVDGDHGLSGSAAAAAEAVVSWLRGFAG